MHVWVRRHILAVIGDCALLCAAPETKSLRNITGFRVRAFRAPRNGGVLKSLQHRQAATFGSARKRTVNRRHLIFTKRQLARRGVIGGVIRRRGFWNREQR